MTAHNNIYKILTIIYLICFANTVRAESINEDQARQAVAAFFSSSSSGTRMRTKGQQLKLRSQGHEAGYYVFDRPEGGCVFVADDDAIGRTVLGYTDAGSYDAASLPAGLQDWLRQVEVLMAAVHEGKISNPQMPVTRAGSPVVEPLILTKWNQYAPYNSLCPVVNGQRCITGCVATAMAQVMYYWRWPAHGYGSVTYDDDGCHQTLSQNLSASHYDWDNMILNYSEWAYNSAEATAVATLMRDCGYAVHMHYTPQESGGGVSASIMQKYFHYGVTARDRSSDSYPEDMWHQFIRHDLDEHRPILYNGASSRGGHEFILDGYDTNGYYHVNWGWGGYQDGWFILTNLNGYNDGQGMISNLFPDDNEDNDFSYVLSADSVLTIKGSGIMPEEYKIKTAPWSDDCEAIRKIIISDGITSIVDEFGYCYREEDKRCLYFKNLKEVSLPEGLLKIGNDAFMDSQLSSVRIPSTVIIMDYAFGGSSQLKSLHLPASIEEYRDYSYGLEKLTIDENNPWLSVEDNILYSKDGKYLFFVPRRLERITIAETTEGIYDSEFLKLDIPIVSKCKKAPTLPKYVRDYPQWAISESGYLFIPCGSTGYDNWQYYLPSGWTVMNYTDISYVPDFKISWRLSSDSILTLSGWGAMNAEFEYQNPPYFKDRNKIKKIVIGEGIYSLAWAAFWNYYFAKDLELPSTLTNINSSSFGYSALTTITCQAKTAPTIGNDVFIGLPEKGTLRVPQGSNYTSWLNALPAGWNIEYIDPYPLATAYICTGEERQVFSIKEWDTLLGQYPNTIGIVTPKRTDWAYLTYNMLVEDTLSDTYRCPYLHLSDLTSMKSYLSEAPQTGFIPPVFFTVMKGEYTRALTSGYNTICLPFAISEDSLPQNCRIYTYSHYDPDKGDVIFNPQTRTEPGHACFVICESAVTLQSNLAGTTITTQPPSAEDDDTRGTYITTDDYQGKGYAPRSEDNIFAPLGQYLHPFRACLFINDPNAPSEVRIRLSDGNDTNGTYHIKASASQSLEQIYTLSGQRLVVPRKGQPYIVNGKIVIR